MYRNLDLHLIRTFCTVAQYGSMTVAAHILSQTQGAISQQIKRLEETLDCILFVRDRPALRVTAAGARLQQHGQRLLALNDAIWSDMASAQTGGRVRVGVPFDLVGTSMAPILRTYGDQHPQVDIVLVCAASSALLATLAQGDIDLALVEEPIGPSAGERLAVASLVWVGAQGGRAHTKEPLPLSLVADTCVFRPALLAALTEHGRDWRIVFENGSYEATMAAVRADLAVSAWLDVTVPPDLQILAPGTGPASRSSPASLPQLPSFAINLHVAPHASTPVVRTFIDHVRAGFAQQTPAAPPDGAAPSAGKALA